MTDGETKVINNYEIAMTGAYTIDQINKLYRQGRNWTRFHCYFEEACTPETLKDINLIFKSIREKRLIEIGY